MLLTEVSNYINCKRIYNLNNKKINFYQIFTNSQNVIKGSIFVISDIKKFKTKYIEEAIAKGAIAVISKKYFKKYLITQFIVENVYESLFLILNNLKSFKPINSLAITGTNGKTTVSWYISKLCCMHKIPNKTFGTLGHYINCKKQFSSSLTTPNYEILHQIAFSLKPNKFNFIFEASSHALAQNRIRKFPINIAALTNITEDHIDYHKSYNSYKNAKFRLFKDKLDKKGYAILNDRIKGINILKKNLISNKIITYGKSNSDINIKVNKNSIKISIFKKKYFLDLINLSKIELENLECAIACCICLNLKIKNILKSIKKIDNPPGRLQKVKNDYYNVYIDFAHTPDALKKVLISFTNNRVKPNLLFGCGGDRDKEKRSKMGIIANNFADMVYVTDDNPRNENPSLIRKSILSKCKKAIEIPDRKKAIRKAIEDLDQYKVLIIAGKGHEKKQIYKNSIKAFDDLKIATKEINKK